MPVRIIPSLNVAGREEVGVLFFGVERPGARFLLQIGNFCVPAGPAERRTVPVEGSNSSRCRAAAPWGARLGPPSVPPFVQQRARTALIYYAVEFAGADHERFRRPTGMAVHTNRMRARSASGRPQRRGMSRSKRRRAKIVVRAERKGSTISTRPHARARVRLQTAQKRATGKI